jgi:GTPase SAR1 family protein
MLRIKEVLDVVYKKLHFEAWDNCLIVVGDEGTGKTNLVLNMFDYWNLKKYGEIRPEFIDRIGMTSEKFAYALKISQKGDFVDYDESGELSNKRQLNNFNILITTSYQVIRNENLMSVLTIPDLFELNPFFTKRRARGLICVYKRGAFAYWNKERLRKIIDYNANAIRKSVWRVKPLFHDNFPIYKGPLKDAYAEMKNEHTKKIKEDIYNKLTENKTDKKMLDVLSRAKETLGLEKTAELFNITQMTIYNRLKGYKKEAEA